MSWQTYENHFQGNTERLQRDYFVFLSWLFFAPFVATVRRRLTLQRLDPIQVPRFGILYGQSNSGKTLLLQTVSRFMFGNVAPTPLWASRITAGQVHAIDRSYLRMPASLDDLGPKRFTDHVHDIIKDETAPPSDEHPCFAISMNAQLNAFIPEFTKRTLLIFTTASFPANREQSRISMANKLASVERTTGLYKRYLSRLIGQIPRHADEFTAFDWKALPSNVIVDNESTPDKLVLDRREAETFIGRDVSPSRWLRLFSRS